MPLTARYGRLATGLTWQTKSAGHQLDDVKPAKQAESGFLDLLPKAQTGVVLHQLLATK